MPELTITIDAGEIENLISDQIEDLRVDLECYAGDLQEDFETQIANLSARIDNLSQTLRDQVEQIIVDQLRNVISNLRLVHIADMTQRQIEQEMER